MHSLWVQVCVRVYSCKRLSKTCSTYILRFTATEVLISCAATFLFSRYVSSCHHSAACRNVQGQAGNRASDPSDQLSEDSAFAIASQSDFTRRSMF